MPLAIELAAGRLSAFSLADLHRRLDRALDLLGGRPGGERPAPDAAGHRRVVLRTCSPTTSGGCSGTCRSSSTGSRWTTPSGSPPTWCQAGDPGTVLSRLVDASMIDAEFAEGGTRYRMLETLRAFGLDRLTAEGEDDDAGDRLLGWAVDLTDVVRVDGRHRARARGGRRAAPRAGEPAGGVASARGRRAIDDGRRPGHRPPRRGHLPRPDRDPGLGGGAGRGLHRRPGARGASPRGRRAGYRRRGGLPPR